MKIDQFVSGNARDSVTDALLLIGADGSILDANATALACHGYALREILTLTIDDIRVRSDDRESVSARTDTDPGTVYEATHCRSDGTQLPVEVRRVAVYARGESATLEVIRDISERRSVEDSLRESDAKHASMISNISDVIGIMGTDGHMKYKSPNIEKWFGWQPDDLIGTDGWLTVHPEDLERMQGEFFSLLAQDGAAKTVEYRYLCKDGSYKWIELTATNLTKDPVIDGVLLNYHDITERRQVERLGAELTAIIDVIGKVSEMRDPYTAGHQRRVAELASAIAAELGMSEADTADIRIAGLMHDVGKMSIPAEILAKPTALSEYELDLVRGHAEAGYSIIASAQMRHPIPELVYHHHERCDGSGYPQGLSASSLVLGSKVLMVADVVEAIMSHRPYRAALGTAAAMAEIRDGRGRGYDSQVTDACVRMFEEQRFSFTQV